MKIIVVGCGRMGAGLAKKLAEAGHFITVIDTDPSAFELLGTFIKCQTITGVGFNRDVLLQAKIERTDALAALTADDDTNIVIAMAARNVFKIPKVIARLCDISKTDIYERLGLQTIDPTTWGIDRVSEILCCTPMAAMHTIGSGSVKVVETQIPSYYAGKTIHTFFSPGEFQVIAISRGRSTFIPAPDEKLQEKDIIHLAVESSAGSRLKELLGIS